MDDQNQKKALRKWVQQALQNLSREEREIKSAAIIEKLCKHPKYREARLLFAYLPFRNEILLDCWIEHAWRNGKRVFVPRVDAATKTMQFYEIRNWQDVEVGNYGIREPKAHCPEYNGSHIDMILVPGVVFSLNKYRIGYGAGYYDRFFAQMTKLPYLLAASYDVQIVPEVPIEPWDIPVDEVLTENRIIF